MTFSHSSCTHPATSRDRSICRKAATAGTATVTTAKPAKARKIDAAPENRAQARQELNDKRTAATKAKNPLKDRSDCFVCGSRSAHIDTKANEPVCMKHIDWNNVKIIPL